MFLVHLALSSLLFLSLVIRFLSLNLSRVQSFDYTFVIYTNNLVSVAQFIILLESFFSQLAFVF